MAQMMKPLQPIGERVANCAIQGRLPTSMDRLARNLDALRQIAKKRNKRCIEFVKESLSFTSQDSPMATSVFSVMGAIVEFNRALIASASVRELRLPNSLATIAAASNRSRKL